MEVPRAGAAVRVPVEEIGQFGPAHYTVRLNLSPLFDLDTNRPTYARFVFPLDEGNSIVNSEGDFATIREYMERLNIKLDGSYIISTNDDGNEQEALVVYVRFPLQGGISDE
jgi:hypothetical protein